MGPRYRSMSNASRQETVISPSPSSLAALQGASRAFGRPPVKPQPPQRTLTGDNGALAAATKANLDYRASSTAANGSDGNPDVNRENNGGRSLSAAQASTEADRVRVATPKSGSLSSRGAAGDARSRSSSTISSRAATLASSRATPTPHSAHSWNSSSNPIESLRSLRTPSFLLPETENKTEDGHLSVSNMSRPSPDFRGNIAGSPATSHQHGPDISSIPPTSSLISQFERTSPGPNNNAYRPRPSLVATSASPDIKSPQPLRLPGAGGHPAAALEAAQRLQNSPGSTSVASSSSTSVSLKQSPNVPQKSKVSTLSHQVSNAASRGAAAAARRVSLDLGSRNVASQPATATAAKPPLRPKPVLQDNQNRPIEVEKSPASPSSSEASFASAVEYRTTKPAPALPPPRRSSKKSTQEDDLQLEPQSSFKHSPSPNLGSAGLPEEDLRRAIAQRYRPSSGAQQLRPPATRSPAFDDQSSSSEHGEKRVNPGLRHASPLMSNDSLANAIVASSLAASRAPSPPKATPSPINISSRHSKTHLPFHRHHRSSESHRPTPSPPKGMRTTMRAPPKEDAEEEKKRRRHLIHKHPNKHHEGDRKRWRDQITERERKRYEGLFASNRGMHVYLDENEQREFYTSKRGQVPWDPEREFVSNVVVRDIWRRSRLPDQLLEEIWDLVDRGDTGKLTKDEFIVGTWLIDQSLKGRKVPAKVTESVWASIRGLVGIKVPKK